MAAPTVPLVTSSPVDPPLGSLWGRLLAQLLDHAVLLAVYAILGTWAATRNGRLTDSGFDLNGTPALLVIGTTLVFSLLYFVVMEGVFGATLGKAVLGLQVRSAGGEQCTFGKSAIRNLLRLVDALFLYLLGLLVALLSKRRQRVGDYAARTIVVRRNGPAWVRAAVMVLWLAILVSLGWGVYQVRSVATVLASSQSSSAEASSASSEAGNASSVSSSVTGAEFSNNNYKVTNFRWLEKADGQARANSAYSVGDDLYASYEFEGYAMKPDGNIDLQLEMSAVDPEGRLLGSPWSDRLQGKKTTGTPIRANFNSHIPPFAPAGTYRLNIKIRDAISGANAEFAPTFEVQRSTPIEPATALEVRNFRYSDSEGGAPLADALYAPGQGVHYAFQLFGGQFTDAHRISIHCAYQLISPDGKRLLDKPDWMNVDDTFYYHPPTFYLPITGNINLPSDVSKGEYKQRYVIIDRIANKTITVESKFLVK